MPRARRTSPLALVLSVTLAACDQGRPAPADSTAAAAAPAASTSLAAAPDRSLTRGDVTINYRAIGAGDPILLVHGFGDRLEMWAGVADSLARDHLVLALDTRGFGKSSKPAGASSYGLAMVDDLVALLDQERLTSAHVVGYSMGAIIAAAMAIRAPERVRSATLVAGGFFPDADSTRRALAPYVADIAQGRRLEGMLRWVVPTLPDTTVKAFSDQLFAESDSAAMLGALQSFPAFALDWGRVATSTVPVVAIVGTADPLRPYSAYLAGRWPGARLVEVPGADHITIIDPTMLAREVRGIAAGAPR